MTTTDLKLASQEVHKNEGVCISQVPLASVIMSHDILILHLININSKYVHKCNHVELHIL
jgi:hypothetical protein